MGKNIKKKNQGAFHNEMLKQHPEHILNNPALQYSGTEAANMAIRDPGHTPGGGVAESKDNYQEQLDESLDQTRSGAIRNQTDDVQNASDNIKNEARPFHRRPGKEGKTMIKNRGYDKD